MHSTIAYYCVADCLVNRFTEENNTSEQIQTRILEVIFLAEEYRVIRFFMYFLSRSRLSGEVTKQYGNRIHD